ncbi:MAG: hypothetical protein ABIU29_06010 [Chthoniobacterales bacterium]
MDDNAQPNDDKKVTKAVTDEPQEEFIEPQARPSRPDEDVAKTPVPPKRED